MSAAADVEALFCGMLLLDNKRIDSVADILSTDDFETKLYGSLYGLIVSEYSQGRSVNPFTLRPLVGDFAGSDEVMPTLLDMTKSSTPLAMNAVDTARNFVERAKRRRLSEALTESVRIAASEAPLASVVDAIDAAIVTATFNPETAEELTAADCVGKLLTSYGEPKKGVKSVVISAIDDLLGPLRRKQLVILAGRPGMGKTAVAISYAAGAAQAGHGVLFVSLEMSGEELAARMAGDLSFNGRSGIPLDDILADDPSPTTVRAVQDAMGQLQDMPLSIVDTGKLTIARLGMMVRRHARRMAAKGAALELVVVDYLQLLSPDTKGRSQYEAVSEISRGLKAIAKDSGVAILALAQLSREVEKRNEKRPALSDLRDSGQIEQDADSVMFLVREEYYLRQDAKADPHHAQHREWQQAMAAVENQIEFICAKRRNGRTGTGKGHFYTRFQAVRG